MTIDEARRIVYEAIHSGWQFESLSREHEILMTCTKDDRNYRQRFSCPTADTEAGRAEAWRILEWVLNSYGEVCLWADSAGLFSAGIGEDSHLSEPLGVVMPAESLLFAVAAAIQARKADGNASK